MHTTVVTETHREVVEKLNNLSSAQVIAQQAASFSSIAHAWQVVNFWTAKVHRAAKYGVFCCVLTPFRRFEKNQGRLRDRAGAWRINLRTAQAHRVHPPMVFFCSRSAQNN